MRYLGGRGEQIDKRLLVALGVLVVFAVAGVLFVIRSGIRPKDTRIIDLLDENREELLGIDGVVGAGIARDEDNHIIGIAVYVGDDVTEIRKIPGELGEFEVFVKRVSEISEFEREKMIIHK